MMGRRRNRVKRDGNEVRMEGKTRGGGGEWKEGKCLNGEVSHETVDDRRGKEGRKGGEGEEEERRKAINEIKQCERKE